MLTGINGKAKVKLPPFLLKYHATKAFKSGGTVPCTQHLLQKCLRDGSILLIFHCKTASRWINPYHLS